MSGPSPIEVLPPEFNQVREAITQAPTTAPNIPDIQTKVTRLSIAQRQRLNEIVSQEFVRSTTAETQARLSQLRSVITPTFTDQAVALPSQARAGIGEAFKGNNRAMTYGLLGVAGFAALMSTLRKKGEEPGFFGKLLKWTGIAAFAGLLLHIPAVGRAAQRQGVRQAEGAGIISSIPPEELPNIADARFEGVNAYGVLFAREMRLGNAVAKLEAVPVSGPTPAHTLLSVRQHTEGATTNRRFRMNILHTLGAPGNATIDGLIRLAAPFMRRDIAIADNEVTSNLSNLLPNGTDGQLTRRGTDIEIGDARQKVYIKQSDFEAMLQAVAALPAPTSPAKRTLTHSLPIYLTPTSTTGATPTTVRVQFNEV